MGFFEQQLDFFKPKKSSKKPYKLYDIILTGTTPWVATKMTVVQNDRYQKWQLILHQMTFILYLNDRNFEKIMAKLTFILNKNYR